MATPRPPDDATFGGRRHRPTRATSAKASADRWIGGFRLVRLLGEGGMGSVFLAEQREPVHRLVALKLMRASIEGPAAAARFAAERQALARLSHPNVAAMYEAGATAEGFPFFVMELVDGVPVTAYCDLHRLTIRERLEPFIHLSKSGPPAHQKRLIH